MRAILRVLFCFISCISISQTTKRIAQENLIWVRYYNTLSIDHKWTLHSEIDSRFFLNNIFKNQQLYRVQGRYKTNAKTEFGVGFALVDTSEQPPNNRTQFYTIEYRLQQDFNWKIKLGKFDLSNRLQVEERFINQLNTEIQVLEKTFLSRYRYRLQGEYIFWEQNHNYLKFIAFDEIMAGALQDFSKIYLDQNRIYFGFQLGLYKNLAIELGCLNIFQKSTNFADRYKNIDIVRLSIFHKLEL